MKKILIIEDDSFLKNLESSKFTHEGFEVATATNQAEIEAVMATGLPTIILLDLMLPDVDGFELLTRFKADDATKGIPVIVFSNLSDDAEMKRVLDAGAAEFMVKSNFTLSDVIEKINALIPTE
ncbi:MAG: response regulator transcription factor [Candidatus Pacebacteria bacterium]|jgi:DNA-binding response OmpR family regulator|nr:response regulator transcription factor [Candidatus Paceibacterota bacterium]MBP9700996.1 response regulator transcription factor [Candidatus Paceibacterota bacterium]